ncbi:uncharacterized protein [Prorops nasuta]|uniref:uncharacterized protein n=1 Tax=Prorops nasuta TaxID=863751 RepID=UPI0034CFAA7A
MDFKESSYYKLNKTLLCLIGQWPYQKRKTYLTRRFVVILYCSVSTLMQLYVLIKKNFDWLLIFAIYPLFMIVLNCLTLAIIFYRSIDKLEELWLSIKEDWAQNRVEEENRIKVSYAESGEAVTRYMTGSNFSFLFLSVAITIIGMTFVILTFFISNILDIVMPTNETRKRVHPFSEEYFFIDEKYFNIILIHSYASVAIILTFVLANISLFYILMQHICGMFAVLGYRFQRMITRKISRQDCDLKSLEEMYSRSIVSSILYHQRVIKFAKLLEAYYSPASMMNTAVFLLTMSPLFVQLSNTEMIQAGFSYFMVLKQAK